MSDERNYVKKIKPKKELEVIKGDGTELDISPAYEHLNDVTPAKDSEKPKNIVVPKEMKKEPEKNEED